MALWMLTLVLLATTVAAFVWARGAGGGSRSAKRRRSAGDEVVYPELGEEGASADAARAPRAPGAPQSMEAEAKSSGNALAWATFGFSAFGTVSTFVLSLLTYLRDVS